MKSAAELHQQFENALKQESFTGSPEELYQPIDYAINQNGKRLRPLLLLMTCDLLGGSVEDAINPAIAVELFHNFTLIHDDIMDKAAIRRGKETVYQKWNENIAILSGDTMFALANKYIAKRNHADISLILEIFNQTAIEVCEGQQMDMNFENQAEVSISEYLEMIRLKTAVLLGCSTQLGAIIAGARQEDFDLIWEFGINLGLAFQLKDDLLDTFGDEQVFGKRTGGDIASNKKTYLYLKALELADNEKKETLKDLYLSVSDNDKKIDRVIDIFRELRIDIHTEDRIDQYYKLAIAALEKINVPEQDKQVLREFTGKIMKRER